MSKASFHLYKVHRVLVDYSLLKLIDMKGEISTETNMEDNWG